MSYKARETTPEGVPSLKNIIPQKTETGQIIILNGVPRSGKSSIVKVIQESFEGPWMNLGVDPFKNHITPKRYSPAIGLRPGGELPDLEPLIVGVRCPIEIIMERRRNTWSNQASEGEPTPHPVRLFQSEVHNPGIYDLEVDTSKLNPLECAGMIQQRLREGPLPSAFQRLAAMSTKQG